MSVEIHPALYWYEYHLFKRCSQLCLAFFCFIFIRWYLKHKNEVLVRWPILDLLPSILKNQHRMQDWSVELANSVGSSVVARGPIFARLNLVLTFDVRNAEYITKTKFSNFPKGADYIEIFDIIGSGIFNMENEYWHAQRKLANTTFMSKEFRSYVAKTTLDVVENSLLPFLSIQSSVIDLEDIFLRFTFDSIFTVIFGRNPNSLSLDLPCNELAQAIDVVTEAIYYRHIVPTSWWKLYRWLMIGSEKKLANAWKIIDHYLEHYVLLKRDDLHKGVQENDMITSFILFLFAGRDSSSTALAWFFWLVERNPYVESKILEELRHVHANKKDKDVALKARRPYVFTAEDLKGLVYLHASLCESLRLYPPLPITHRGVQKEDVLPDGTKVKPGWKILISMYAMGRSESVWGKDCLEYKPERWIDENGKLNPIPLTKFFTFFAGPRNCIGKDMAFTQMKLVIGAVLFNFHVELVEGHTVRAKSSIVLHMQDGLKVRLRERITQE
ncbi:hypothetical protein AQUCO_05700041v1 [Aquilegia coerulea]|uniref:Cytochrome P450 n=1 Tax=Aquilegia coerulea TaxID=218851 RepID=A0A2G5CFI8_AQUCA|nr:hypothetical protein AQUCO_05700041v1 [Aquilegia coerulea]